MNKPYVIGLTGGIGSGKTAATDFLSERGAAIVDADVESRALTAQGGEALPRIREAFGEGVFDENGLLNRRALGALVFADREKRLTLEGIMHPMIQNRMIRKIRTLGAEGVPFIILSVPLLFETGMDALCDETWCLALPAEEQLKRVMARDGMTREEAAARIASQMPLEEKCRRASLTIRTNRPIEATQAELASLLRDVRKRLS